MKISAQAKKEIAAHQRNFDDVKERATKAIATMLQCAEDIRATLENEFDTLRGEFDDKSERWQESERGESVSAWLDSIEELATESIDVDDTDSITLDDLSDLVSRLVDFESEPS